MPSNYRYIPVFKQLQEEFGKGNDGILRGATAVLFFYTEKKARFGCQDCNLAYQNASLMAEALGVAQFYTGFVCTAAGMNRKKNCRNYWASKAVPSMPALPWGCLPSASTSTLTKKKFH